MTPPEHPRLNRFLARTGCGSRRGVEALILAGRVAINGETVLDLGRRVNPETDQVTLDDKPVVMPAAWRVFAFHKPPGVISSLSPQGDLPCLVGFRDEAGLKASVIPVGRLDAPTSGLLIWTDDGALAQDLLLPRRHVWKRYYLRLDGELAPSSATKIIDGSVEIDGRACLPARLKACDDRRLRWIMWLREGRNRQIRRMFEAVGRRVISLHREAFGSVELGDLLPGQFRELSDAEVRDLRGSISGDDKSE